MQDAGLNYGNTYPVEFFENGLNRKRGTKDFDLDLLRLRTELEREHGYYLRCEEGGSRYSIPSAADHEEVALTFEGKMRRYCVRSIHIRVRTLANPLAVLTAEQRRDMEHGVHKQSTRLLLMSRAQSVEDYLMANKPELLAQK